MNPVRKKVYFGVVPEAGVPGPALPKPISDEAFHRRATADFFLLALIFTSTVFVLGMILDWSY
jgi:hypothetical protein